jgi:hypothetical protein
MPTIETVAEIAISVACPTCGLALGVVSVVSSFFGGGGGGGGGGGFFGFGWRLQENDDDNLYLIFNVTFAISTSNLTSAQQDIVIKYLDELFLNVSQSGSFTNTMLAASRHINETSSAVANITQIVPRGTYSSAVIDTASLSRVPIFDVSVNNEPSAIPSSNQPFSSVPTSSNPTSSSPLTSVPSSSLPSSSNPITTVPSSSSPSSHIPFSSLPSVIPSSNQPFSSVPTSSKPTSASSLTSIPSSSSSRPSVSIPSSAVQSSSIPTQTNRIRSKVSYAAAQV